jgi:hypothetical protein
MSKKILIIIGIVVALGLVGYLIFNQIKSPNPIEVATRLADDSAMAEKTSLKDLINQNKPMMCEFSGEGMVNKFYLADKKMRSDNSFVSDNKTIINHTIVINNTSYTWSEGATTGFKVTVEDNDVASNKTESTTNDQAQIDFNQQVDYRCVDWAKDETYFELPSNVTFTDLNAMMPATNPAGNNSETPSDNGLKAMQCAACDSAPADSRAECRAALNCD